MPQTFVLVATMVGPPLGALAVGAVVCVVLMVAVAICLWAWVEATPAYSVLSSCRHLRWSQWGCCFDPFSCVDLWACLLWMFGGAQITPLSLCALQQAALRFHGQRSYPSPFHPQPLGGIN